MHLTTGLQLALQILLYFYIHVSLYSFTPESTFDMFRARVCVNMCYIFLPLCLYMILSWPIPSQTVYSSISIMPCNSPGRVRLFCPLSQSLYFHRHQLPTPFSLTQSWRGRKRKGEKEGGGEGGVEGRVVNSYHVWIWHLDSWQKEGGILSFIIYCYQLLTGLSGWGGGKVRVKYFHKGYN